MFFWINLDAEFDRREHMNSLFDEYGIENTRIPAIDARGSNDVTGMIIGTLPSTVTQVELGCTVSHLKAINHFYEETELDHAIICEDDILFDTVQYWPFTWKEFISKAPYDWDVLQCAITSTETLAVNIHPRRINDFCSAFYVITRHHAKKLLRAHKIGNKFKLDQGIKPRATSEELIYNSGKTYSIPLFVYRCDFVSGIHQEHVETLHKPNFDRTINFWKNRPPELGADQLLDYDFYGHWQSLVGG
jgi:Glycosyltransferase involved in LPS biosynthesis